MPRELDPDVAAEILQRVRFQLDADGRFEKIRLDRHAADEWLAAVLAARHEPCIVVDRSGVTVIFDPGEIPVIPVSPAVLLLVDAAGGAWLTASGELCLAGVLAAAK